MLSVLVVSPSSFRDNHGVVCVVAGVGVVVGVIVTGSVVVSVECPHCLYYCW